MIKPTLGFVLKRNDFPEIAKHRGRKSKDSEYFGPFTNVKLVRIILNLLKEIYPIRNCKFNLSKQNVGEGKFKVCLEYHLKNCLGPCENLQSEASYDNDITQIKKILKGETKDVIDYLKNSND